jgi:hypothetical protein
VHRFADNLSRAFPNLDTLVLTNNQLVTLKEIEPLAQLTTLTSLSLSDNLVSCQLCAPAARRARQFHDFGMACVENACSEIAFSSHLMSKVCDALQVTKQKGYRSFVIALLPKLRVLDFTKIKHAERKEAQASLKRNRADDADTPGMAKTFMPGADSAVTASKAGPTPEQIAMIKAAIANASSLEEVAKLEKVLKAGDYDAVFAATGGGGASAELEGSAAAQVEEE